ncbi:hypothetical protein E8E13_009602 [Curvularia kusanoi]|uniref:LYC1 C-terminal domain-containing protein n=1 Tax=Curvularia kusanoi TaxID=90978 RepID=A0A9P4WAA3_CURKU|nr:hypothetical protein E8E13_009602 [Curvularia kusanoi]
MSAAHLTITLSSGTVITVLFGEATAQQQLECDKFAANGRGLYLDEDEILAREAYLRKQNLIVNGGGRTWCLYRQDDQNQVLSTCKTMRRTCLLEEAESAHTLEGYCITSVYTPLVYRGHGLASHLLRKVAEWLDGPGAASLSMLYSGIPRYYEALGWDTLPNDETILSISPWIQDTLDSDAGLDVRSLLDADIEELCAQESRRHTRTGVGQEASKLYVVPTADIVRYQQALSDHMGELWQYEAPKIRGAAYKCDWICWYHDFGSRTLRIQHVHKSIENEESKEETMIALFLHAVREANNWSFTTVSTRDTSARVRTALRTLAEEGNFTKSVSEIKRAQKISLRWKDGNAQFGNVVMDNESYAWNLRY